MQKLLAGAACLAASTALVGQASSDRGSADAGQPQSIVVLDNARVRILKADASLAADHPAAVIVPLSDAPTGEAGDAYWSGDAAARPDADGQAAGLLLIVEPKASGASPASPQSSADAARPDQPVFTGITFKTIFENDRVAVIRARMDVDAREGFHTHSSDIIVVHLSGGAIEDTADGATRVNRWTRGDVEFEARGSSHSAHNAGAPIDVVLIRLKP